MNGGSWRKTAGGLGSVVSWVTGGWLERFGAWREPRGCLGNDELLQKTDCWETGAALKTGQVTRHEPAQIGGDLE